MKCKQCGGDHSGVAVAVQALMEYSKQFPGVQITILGSDEHSSCMATKHQAAELAPMLHQYAATIEEAIESATVPTGATVQ